MLKITPFQTGYRIQIHQPLNSFADKQTCLDVLHTMQTDAKSIIDRNYQYALSKNDVMDIKQDLSLLCYEPLLLLNECMADYCELSRQHSSIRSNTAQLVAAYIELNEFDSVCSFGPGFLFHDVEMLAHWHKFSSTNATLNYYIVQDVHDYFDYPSWDGLVGIDTYNGPRDDNEEKRRAYFSMVTCRLISWLQWMKSVNMNVNVYWFPSADMYQQCTLNPGLTWAFDILDDFAEWALQGYLTCLYSQETTGLLISVQHGRWYFDHRTVKECTDDIENILPSIQYVNEFQLSWRMIKWLTPMLFQIMYRNTATCLKRLIRTIYK